MPNPYEDSLALADRYYAAFNAGDVETMLGCLSEDVAHDINQGGRETGKQAFRAFMARMDEAYSELLRDIVLRTMVPSTIRLMPNSAQVSSAWRNTRKPMVAVSTMPTPLQIA